MPNRLTPAATLSSRFVALCRPITPETLGEWCGNAATASPFQTQAWLTSWYRAFTGRDVEPLFVEVRDAQSGAGTYALPLLRRRAGGLSVIEFADLGVSDYNLPLPGPSLPRDPAEARAAWEAVSAALPAADLCEFRKMPGDWLGRPNPLLQALGGHASPLAGHVIATGDDLEAWRHTRLSPNNRRNFARLWRVFQKHEQARFIDARSLDEAAPILAWLETAQSQRAAELPHMRAHYRLDEPEFADFYRQHLIAGLARREVIITALKAGDTFVAAIYAIAAGSYYAVVRITFNPDFYNCSPARLLIERSITALHAEGFRTFDLTTGDYPYKKTFETAPLPLYDVVLGRTLRGWPAMGLAETKAFVKSRPRLERLVRRLMPARAGAPAANEAEPPSGAAA